ncbi:GHMP kinase [Candidatus Poribacteria bacterium]|nr:MAG: GHMP kinase [Candidatus Poribacteria bacterium]
MTQAKAFAPGNLSCVFKIIPHPEATKMHSLGMGFTITEGVVVAVSQQNNRTTVQFNGSEIYFPTVVSVIQKLTPQPIQVEIESPLPLGCGFGLSGAASLATTYALNDLLGLGKSEEELAMTAHVAEVENRTGLGDVCAQYHGGCLVKLKRGYPLAAERLPIPAQPIYYRYFSSIQTKTILESVERRERINRAADETLQALEKLAKSEAVDFNACIRLSKQFSLNSGLLEDSRVKETISQIEEAGGVASMIMLGNAVFSTHPFEGATETTLSEGERGRLL